MRVRIEVGPPKEKLGVPEARDWMMGSPTHTHIHACFLTPPTLPKPFAGAKLLIIITVAQRLTAGSERNPDSVFPPSGGPLAHPAQGEILQFPRKAGGQSPERDEIPEEKDRETRRPTCALVLCQAWPGRPLRAGLWDQRQDG